jgi:hypothetical protein
MLENDATLTIQELKFNLNKSTING